MKSTLRQLVEGLNLTVIEGGLDSPIERVTADSREVIGGSLFVAVKGHDSDGHDYIDAAIERGAVGVVIETPQADLATKGVTVAQVADTRSVLSLLLGRFYRHPDRALSIVAVTGTNGKTTVSHLVRDLLESMGKPCGLLGTIQYETGAASVPAPLTTPGAENLVALLAQMRDHGLGHVAMEASSHALDQQRLAGIEVDVAAFTNLSREHLDYHANMEEYFAAKRRLLDHLAAPGREKEPGIAVVNADDATFAAHDWPTGTIFLGRGQECDLRLEEYECTREHTRLRVVIDGAAHECLSSLLGSYNVENLLVVAGIASALGYDGESIARHFPSLRSVAGRLEPVELAGGPLVLIDYAHTPEGMRSALSAVREITEGRLTVVFGCGGDRDRGKRPLMARAALEMADDVVLTLDNPRTEDPAQIFADAEAGIGADVDRIRRIEDRREAVGHAISTSSVLDTVLVAGKGHETYQIVGTEKLPWDDREVIRAAHAAQGGGA